MIQKNQFDRKINFHIDSKLLKHLDAIAIKRGWKRNFTIREAIKKYIEVDRDAEISRGISKLK